MCTLILDFNCLKAMTFNHPFNLHPRPRHIQSPHPHNTHRIPRHLHHTQIPPQIHHPRRMLGVKRAHLSQQPPHHASYRRRDSLQGNLLQADERPSRRRLRMG